MIAAVGSDTVPAPSAPVPNTQSLELHLNQNNPVCWNNDLSTERQFLWQYFIFAVKPEFMAIQMGEVTSPLGEFQDPYSTFLPCLALENPALRNALLCSSAVSFQHTHGRRDFDGIIRAVAREALQSLQMQALDPQGLSDWNLLATILAATYLHVQCFAWEKSDGYLHLATYFAQTLFRRSRRQHAVAKECLEMTLVTYRWSMISTLCSLREPQRALIPKDVCRVIELDGNEISQNFSTAFQDWVSHPLYVFSPHLVNPLLRIGKLLEQQLLLQAQDASDPTVDGVDLGQSFQDEIADVEKMLVEAREANMDQVESSTGRGEPKMFLSVNEATYATSMVLLNARLKGMPYTAPLIREHVQLIVNEISGPALDSQLSRSCAFYLFIAGCEAVDTQVREAIESRLKVLTWSVFSNLADLCASLHHVWKIRDQEPGLAWPYWAQKSKYLHFPRFVHSTPEIK
ncbi:hypothetical protein NQ176_g7217 [Zarea fungicola]|uniref:Uncharacterized protein n=1 Tax=Zarea fungicola TaxID=93591 RepID=A0ACC1N0N9_9HYPO|nr:hypothetical protein NQ176_g7217 [Lecanicillium fungicola]